MYLFGVKIPPKEQHSPEAKQIRARYIIMCFVGMVGTVAICIVQFMAFRGITLLTTLYLPFLIITVFFAVYIPNWKAATRLKAKQGWQVSGVVYAQRTIPKRGRLMAVPWGWYLVSFAIIMASVLTANFRYGSLPQMIPIRFGINMQPTVLATRTWLFAFMYPLINAAVLLVMTFIAVMIQRVKLQVDPAQPRVSYAQHTVYRRRLGHVFGLLTVIIVLNIAAVGLVVLFPYSALATRPLIFWGGWGTILIMIGIIEGVTVNSGQGGYKIKVDISEDAQGTLDEPVHDAQPMHDDDDKHWKLGLFYHNADDPAGLVEHRFGSKLSFNFARLPAKVAVMLIAAGVIVAYVWMTILLSLSHLPPVMCI